MFEKHENEIDNGECVIKGVYFLHLRLENGGIMTDEAPFRRRIQLSSNFEQVVMF